MSNYSKISCLAILLAICAPSFGDKVFYGWKASCPVDEMTDEKSCFISNSQSGFFAFFVKSGIISVSVIGHDYPGEFVTIRTGKHKAFYGNGSDGALDASDAGILVKTMKEGDILRTRHYNWPSDAGINKKVLINKGFKLAYQYVQEQLGNKKAATVKLKKIPNNKANNSHSHAGRIHSHPLPAQGKSHRHGNGAIGK